MGRKKLFFHFSFEEVGMKRILFVLIFVSFFFCGLLYAEKDTVHDLGEIVVTATKTDAYTEEVGSSVTVITGGEIKEEGKRNVSDVLRGIMGLTTVQTGGLGGISSVYIRGTKPGYTLVMIDGVEVNDPMNIERSFDFANLLTDDVERIEIVRGPQSTLYGSDAIGGVINIITKKGEGKTKIDASFEGGSYETFRENAGISGATERMDYFLMLSRVDSNGFSRAKDGAEDDGYENTGLSSRLGFKVFKESNLDFILRYTKARSDIDDAAYDDDPNYIGRNESWLGKAEFKQVITSWWNHKLSLSYQNIKRNYFDGLDTIGRTTDKNETKSRYKGDNKKAEWQNNFPVSEIDTITGGIEYEIEGGSSSYVSGSYESDIDRKTVDNKAVYLQNLLTLWECFFSTLGVRIDDHQRCGTEDTYKISLAYLIKKIGTELKANWGTGFKAPTLYELYSSYGDPDLKPDKSRGYDIGFVQNLFNEKLSFNLAYFHNNIKDMIDWDWADYKYKNIGRVMTKGIEAGAKLNLMKNLGVLFSYTYTETEDKETGLELLRRPKNQGSVNINWRFLENRGNLNLIAIYVGKREDTNTTVYPSVRTGLDSYTRVDLACSYEFSKNIELFGRIENLFNKDYEEVYGYATPGISAYGGIKAEF